MPPVGRSVPITGALSMLVFLAIALLVLSNTTQSVDALLALAINNLALGHTFTSIMVAFSNYGREYFWIPVVATMLVVGSRDTKLLTIELAVLFVAGITFGEALKYLTYRDRPFEAMSGILLRVPSDTGSSFPSGHALIATIGAAFSRVKFESRVVTSLLTLEAALVCYSRVYIGMHYPLDVAAGIFLGIGIVEVGLPILEGRKVGAFLNHLADLAAKVFRDRPAALVLLSYCAWVVDHQTLKARSRLQYARRNISTFFRKFALPTANMHRKQPIVGMGRRLESIPARTIIIN
jgi:membrane-associated phospholipid phosphatase